MTASQNRKVLRWLASGKTLTSLQALRLFACLRLSGRILELRQLGHRIESRMIAVGRKRVAEYRYARR